MDNTKLLVIDIETDVVATPTLITFDKQKYIDIIDQMPLEQLTAGFFKKIEDSAINIDKTLSAPIKAWRLVVKEIVAHGESRIAELKRISAEIEAKRVAEKTKQIDSLLFSIKGDYKLPSKYLNAVISKPQYINKGTTLPQIEADIIQQIDIQARLYKADLDAIELKTLKIKNREQLVDKFNLEYGLTYTYSDFNIDIGNTDNDVKDHYILRHKQDLLIAESQAKAKVILEEREKAKALAEAEVIQATAKKIFIGSPSDKPHSQLREEAHARQEATEQLRGEIQEAKALEQAQLSYTRTIELESKDQLALEKAVTFIQSIILKQDTVTITIL